MSRYDEDGGNGGFEIPRAKSMNSGRVDVSVDYSNRKHPVLRDGEDVYELEKEAARRRKEESMKQR